MAEEGIPAKQPLRFMWGYRGANHVLRGARLPPSIIVYSSGGYHAYWVLDEATRDLHTARLVLRGLARTFGGDGLSPAQSLRLPGTVNCKPEPGGALCRLIESSDRHYRLSDFQTFIPPTPHSTLQTLPSITAVQEPIRIELTVSQAALNRAARR